MHDVDAKRSIILENYIDRSLFTAFGGRTFTNIFVKDSKYLFYIYS